MSDPTLMRLRRGMVQLVEDVLRSWPAERLDAKLAQDVAEALRVCRSWPEELEEVADSLWRRAAANQIDDSQQAGERVLDLVEHAVKALEQLALKVQDFERQGRPILEGKELPTVTDRLRRFRQQFQESWPWWNAAIVQEALAEYARGEAQSAREILDELQGKHR